MHSMQPHQVAVVEFYAWQSGDVAILNSTGTMQINIVLKKSYKQLKYVQPSIHSRSCTTLLFFIANMG